MSSKLLNKAAARRIALSAGKAFLAGIAAFLVAHQADLTGLSTVKALAIPAIFAGFDAAAKAIQISLES
jgi:hypothetical protein